MDGCPHGACEFFAAISAGNIQFIKTAHGNIIPLGPIAVREGLAPSARGRFLAPPQLGVPPIPRQETGSYFRPSFVGMAKLTRAPDPSPLPQGMKFNNEYCCHLFLGPLSCWTLSLQYEPPQSWLKTSAWIVFLA